MKDLCVHIKSFGCQMNKLDSALISSALTAKGCRLTDNSAPADIVIINTCSVREHAEQKVISHIGMLRHLKKKKPEMIIIIAGCMAQRLGRELIDNEDVDIVCGPSYIPRIPELIEEFRETKLPQLAVSETIRSKNPAQVSRELDDFESAYDSDRHAPSQAFVRIMRGCNQMCTYCVVPYVRGPEISRNPGEIIEQIKRLAGEGVKQVTLLGQTVNSYWYKTASGEYRLADLLDMVKAVEGIEWIRFITSHPGRFDDAVLHAMADLPKVCPYLHIPAQSGSNRILKAMNRGYTAEQYLEFIAKARSIVPDIAVAGDFIVGFPGETEEDFKHTVELVKKTRYKNCFVFKYSPRPGTNAIDKMKDDVPAEIKKQRNIELLEIQNNISEQDNRKFKDRSVKVLVEGPSKKPHLDGKDDDDLYQLVGRTAGDYIVVFSGSEKLAGQFAEVKIVKTAALTLFGEIEK